MSDSFPLFGNDNGNPDYDPDKLIDLFLNGTADGFAIVDMESRFIRVNRMYTNIFGYSEEEVLGRKFEEFANLAKVREIVERVKKGETYTNLILQYYHKEGKILDIAVSYSPFRNSSGEIIAVIGIFRDVTTYMDLERELKKTRELYRLITENTTDLISIFLNTRNKTIIFASPSYETTTGRPPAQLIGKSLYDFISAEEAKYLEKIINKLVETGEPVLFEREIKTAHGQTIYAEYNISPNYNETGEIRSFLMVARNITDRVKNEAALRNLDRLSVIGQLAAGVAHEIRNPLTSLKGFSKLMVNEKSRDKQEKYLEIIRNELDRIDSIVNEFMSLAKPQAIQFENVKLLPVIESTVNIFRPQALMENIRIILDCPEDIELHCSPNQLMQVFVNFLKNAIEAMPEGGDVVIKVRKIKPGRVMISFIDEGTGIDPEVVGLLGTPFYTTKDKGIGLGLTVSNKIVQEHNGTMNIDSQIGSGTTVSIELDCLD